MITKSNYRRAGCGSSRWRRLLLAFGGMVTVGVVAGAGQAMENPAYAAVPSAAERADGTSAQTATYYASGGLGNCSYPSPPADRLYAALSPSEYRSATACGGYLQVKGPDGSVRVKVIDQCPGCAAGHIDLSESAFARLAPLPDGLIKVTYTHLSDPPLPGPVSVEVKLGSSRYWLALLADNTGNPLASVQVETSAGWRSLARASYNYWIAPSGSGPGPFTVRLTDTQGHQVTVPGIALSPGAVQSTKTWMYGGGRDPEPAPSASPSPPGKTRVSFTPRKNSVPGNRGLALRRRKSFLTTARHGCSVRAVCRGAGMGTRLVARAPSSPQPAWPSVTGARCA
jgi:expansin (peptidoglycan-binding protein)